MKIDVDYYRTVAMTQSDPEILSSEMLDLIQEIANFVLAAKASELKDNTSPCCIGLFCRVRSEGETMRSGDIVLISDTFRPLGFHTDFYHYFAGLEVVEGMTGKIICKAT